MGADVKKRRFTVDEYHQMAQAGVLSEDDRVELIVGEVVEMAPVGCSHAACVKRINRLLSGRLGDQAILSIQDPIRLGEQSEPQPDVALLYPRTDYYASAHPGPRDVLLLIEVAQTSVDYDRSVKLPLYAQAGIPEVWLVDLAGDAVEISYNPTPQGYDAHERAQRGRQLSPQALPQLHLRVEEILG